MDLITLAKLSKAVEDARAKGPPSKLEKAEAAYAAAVAELRAEVPAVKPTVTVHDASDVVVGQ